MSGRDTLLYQHTHGENGEIVQTQITPKAGFEFTALIIRGPIPEGAYSVKLRPVPNGETGAAGFFATPQPAEDAEAAQ